MFIYKTQGGNTIYINPNRHLFRKFGEYTIYALDGQSDLEDRRNWIAKIYFKALKQQSIINSLISKRGIDPQCLLFFKDRCVGYLMRADDKKILCYTEQHDFVVVDTDMDSRVGDPGGEAEVYSLNAGTELYKPDKLVAKIYHKPPSNIQVEKLELLLKKRKEGKLPVQGVCFPVHILYSGYGQKKLCIGYLMKRFYGDTLLNTVFQPHRIETMLHWTRVDICAFAETLLRRFIDLHKVGIIVGDINPKNVLVSYDPNNLAIIDTDSFQIDGYPCPVHFLGFDPPRLLNETDFSTVMRTHEDEDYSITVLLFEIFLIGKHPYARSDEGILEEYIRKREFVFPVGYDDNKLIPKGVYQMIWYNLPYEMRVAFYNAFHYGKLLPLSKWLPIIENYKKDLLQNWYPNDVFSENVKPVLKSEDRLPALTMRDVGPDEIELTQVENVLCRDSRWRKSDIPFIQFGTSFIRCYLFRAGTIPSTPKSFKSRNIDFVDRQGNFMVDEFLNSPAVRNLENWLEQNANKRIKPPIRVLYAFGGTFLRSLSNRVAVIKALEDHFGIHFGILSLEQEANMLIEECHRNILWLRDKPILMIKQSSLAMRIIIKNNEGQISHYTFDDLGLLRMRDKLFSTAHPTMATQTMLDIHDQAINDQLNKIDFVNNHDITIIAVGVLKELMPKSLKKDGIKRLTLENIDNEIEALNERLSTNRSYARQLAESLKVTNYLEEKLNLRLGLPICAHIMKRLGVDRILLLHLGLGESFIAHTLHQLTN